MNYISIYSPSDNIYHNDSDDDDDDDELEKIEIEESPFLDFEKTHGQYYLGIAKVTRKHELLMANSLSLKTFYKYDISTILHYLQVTSIVRYNATPRMHIIQLQIDNGVYKAVIKTYWIRIIQRTWKRIYKEKILIAIKRSLPAARHFSETYGKYPRGLNVLPGLHGMISNV